MKTDNISAAAFKSLMDAAKDPETANVLNRLMAVYEENQALKEQIRDVNKQLKKAQSDTRAAKNAQDRIKGMSDYYLAELAKVKAEFKAFKESAGHTQEAEKVKELEREKAELETMLEVWEHVLMGYPDILSKFNRVFGDRSQARTARHDDCKVMSINLTNK